MTVHLCLISDDNYVMPTCAAIKSVIASKNASSRYVIHVIASALSPESKAAFSRLGTEAIEIDVIKKDPFVLKGLHTFAKNAICVASVSALFKFLLPEIFGDLDRVLYLDGDIVCRCDLSELYQTDVDGSYAAVVPDSGQIYYQHDFVRRVKRYFNSGVMLLNLLQMRRDALPGKLIKAKQELADSNLMDQNVFNVVFDGHVKYLPIRYNFMPVSLIRARGKWTLRQVNALFGTDYASERDLFADAAIIHYSSKDKPWKDPDGAMASEWRVFGGECRTDLQHPKVSVVMPTYNVAAYVEAALESLQNQTFSDFEVICLDDGSADETVAVVEDCQRRMPMDIRLVRNSNFRQGYERNRGIELASGRYVYFMDSDDVLKPHALERIVGLAEANELDLLFFEGESFYETERLRRENPRFDVVYRRTHAHPLVYGGCDLYCELRTYGDLIISPCLQLVRRDLLLSSKVAFPEDMPMMEDNLYTVRVLLSSRRVAVTTDVLYRRRVRAGSTMTGNARSLAEFDSCIRLYDELVALANRQPKNSYARGWLLQHALAFVATASHLGGDLPSRVRLSEPSLRQEMKNCLSGMRRRTPLEVMKGARRCLLDNGWKYTILHAIGRILGRV